MKPFVTCAPDYHDFHLIATTLEHEHSTKVDYLEIGCGHSELHHSGCAYYHAVFFLPKDKKTAEEMKKEWKENHLSSI